MLNNIYVLRQALTKVIEDAYGPFLWAETPPPEEIVNIDRPFVYMIRDKITGLILFTGRVVFPES